MVDVLAADDDPAALCHDYRHQPHNVQIVSPAVKVYSWSIRRRQHMSSADDTRYSWQTDEDSGKAAVEQQ